MCVREMFRICGAFKKSRSESGEVWHCKRVITCGTRVGFPDYIGEVHCGYHLVCALLLNLVLQVIICANINAPSNVNGAVPCAILLKAWQIMKMGYSMAFCGLYNNPTMVTLLVYIAQCFDHGTWILRISTGCAMHLVDPCVTCGR